MKLEDRLRSHACVRGAGECWIWTGSTTSTGYGRLNLRGHVVRAHRLVFFLAHGFAPPVVMHSCDHPGCVNPAHLRAGSTAANIADKIAKGRHVRGRGVGAAKLSEELVGAIREAARPGVSQRELGARFGIDQAQVSRVLAGKAWKHVKLAAETMRGAIE